MSGRTYTETERIGTMVLALRLGVVPASEQTGTPERTIRQWFEDAGGIAEVRRFVEEAKEHALLRAAQAVGDEVTKRLSDISNEELMETFRELMREKGGQQPAVSVTNVQESHAVEYRVEPEALARALVTLNDAGALPALPSGNGSGGAPSL